MIEASLAFYAVGAVSLAIAAVSWACELWRNRQRREMRKAALRRLGVIDSGDLL